MNLDDRLTNVLWDMHSRMRDSHSPSTKDIFSFIDLTILDPSATSNDINTLATKAHQYHTAAICVLPNHIEFIPDKNPIQRATVMNFPEGIDPIEDVLKAIDHVVNSHQLHEIDYVFPYRTYLSGHHVAALADCHKAYQHCKQHGLTFKVILETGALPSNNTIYDIATAILHQGCDFLKTSTGKIKTGATIPAVFSILAAMVDTNIPSGIKVSGGIKTTEQAETYIRLAEYMLNKKADSQWFRLGASSLLDDLLRP